MADTLSNLEENSHSIFHTSPLTLLELASMKIALHTWLEKYRKYGKIVDNSRLDTSHLDRDELQSHTMHNVPQKIRTMIDSSLDPITWQLEWWYQNSRAALRMFSHDNQVCRRFDLVVFGGDGDIHIRDTIANFFQDDSLSDEIKFEIACVHCVEEKVDFYWPSVEDSRYIDFGDVCVRYWIDVKEGNVMPHPNREMISKCCTMHLRLGIEYFVALCNSDERLAQTVDWFHFNTRPRWYLLPLIDSTWQRYVLDEFEIRVFQEFFQNLDLCKYAVQAFLYVYVKDSLTIERFYTDVILYCIRIMNEGWYGDKHQHSMDKTLAELWFIVPIDWRRRILNFHFPDILEELHGYEVFPSSSFGRYIGFLLAMLSDADAELRNRFWMVNWSKWIVNVPPAQIEELMTLCLVETEVIDFKRKFPNTGVFRNYCGTLMFRGYHRKMNIFINSLYPNREQAVSIKKHLLENHTAVFSLVSQPQFVCKIYSECIDQVFSDPDLAADFKYRLILSDRVWHRLREKIYKNRFNDVKYIVELFIPIHKSEEIKGKLLESFRSQIVKGESYPFDRRCWKNFLDWANDKKKSFSNR